MNISIAPPPPSSFSMTPDLIFGSMRMQEKNISYFSSPQTPHSTNLFQQVPFSLVPSSVVSPWKFLEPRNNRPSRMFSSLPSSVAFILPSHLEYDSHTETHPASSSKTSAYAHHRTSQKPPAKHTQQALAKHTQQALARQARETSKRPSIGFQRTRPSTRARFPVRRSQWRVMISKST